jgi:hypothetical protein
MLPILTMRFKFKTLQQKQNWVRYTTSLKNRYAGLSFEIFYMNDDGTCNYQKMINEIDKHISDGVLNPKKIYDPYNHLKRDYNNPYIAKHVELMRQLKNLFRILIVGVEQYCKENFKILGVVTKNTMQPSKPSYMHSENYLNYGNTNKYSDVGEYLNHAS